jgi:hypothetical protein
LLVTLKTKLTASKINDAHREFDKPIDVTKDQTLSHSNKKQALDNLAQDAHQLLTASNEGMAPADDAVAQHEPLLDKVTIAQERIGEKPLHKPAQ